MELTELVEKVKAIYQSCNMGEKLEPVVGDALENTGIAFLLASNCFKDLGILCLIGDTVVKDPKNWKNDVIVTIFIVLLGKQGMADCGQFLNFIHPHY